MRFYRSICRDQQCSGKRNNSIIFTVVCVKVDYDEKGSVDVTVFFKYQNCLFQKRECLFQIAKLSFWRAFSCRTDLQLGNVLLVLRPSRLDRTFTSMVLVRLIWPMVVLFVVEPWSFVQIYIGSNLVLIWFRLVWTVFSHKCVLVYIKYRCSGKLFNILLFIVRGEVRWVGEERGCA